MLPAEALRTMDWLVAELIALSWNAPLVTGAAGSVGATVSGGVTHLWQARKARVLPALPSHVEATCRPDDESTRFFAAVHDLTMAVTGAWNAVRARRSGGRVEEVIQRDELRRCRDAIVRGDAAIRERLAPQSRRALALSPIVEVVRGTWTYTNRHNYRTETYTVTRTVNGKTTTETRTRQVYVNTDHWFSFDRNSAERARKLVATWLADSRSVRWHTLGLHQVRVRIDRLSPAEKSFLDRIVRTTVLEDPEAELTDAELEACANQWLLGTNIDANLEAIAASWRSLVKDSERRFAEILASNTNYHFRTTSRTHSGPPGYVANQLLLGTLRSGAEAWSAIDGMLRASVSTAQQLVAWSEDNTRVESDREYADAAVALYKLAFPGSALEIDQLPRWGWTAAIAAITGALSALGAYAAHPAGLALLM